MKNNFTLVSVFFFLHSDQSTFLITTVHFKRANVSDNLFTVSFDDFVLQFLRFDVNLLVGQFCHSFGSSGAHTV